MKDAGARAHIRSLEEEIGDAAKVMAERRHHEPATPSERLHVIRSAKSGWGAELATFGSIRGDVHVERSRDLGSFGDEAALAHADGASDVYALPSREDNLPNVLVEVMACGVPCVAFDIGGVGDVVDHRINGYLARPFDVVDFALGDRERYRALSAAARDKVERCFDLDACAPASAALYERVAGGEPS